MNEYILGLSYVFIASMLWSIAPALISRFAREVSELVFTGFRSLFASLALGLLLVPLGFDLCSFKGLFVVFISAVLGPLIGAILYLKTIKLIGSGNAVTVSYLYIFFAQLFSTVFLGEEASTKLFLGTALALTGVYIVYHGEGRVFHRAGLIYGFSTALAWGSASAILKTATLYCGSLTISFLRNLFSTLLLTPYIVNGWREVVVSRERLLTALFTGAFGLGVGMWLFILAIKHVGVSAAVLVTSLTPIVARLASKYIAGEETSLKAYMGTMVTSTGIVIGLFK